jgi:sulfite exporter TauE/SafE
MTTGADLPVILTGFLAGILGSGHCFGMCGGIAGTFGALAGRGGGRFKPALLFNLGRLCSYVLLGAILAVLLGGTGTMLDIPGWSRALRLVTAVMILLIGLRFLLGLSLLERIERLGAGLWNRVRPLAVRLSSRPGATARLLLGMCWGLVPCGLVYSMLLTAASTASAVTAGAVMLAFGSGTLPSMLGVAWAAPALASIMEDRWVRRIIGFALVLLAAWTIAMTAGAPMHGGMHASG